MVLPRNRNKIFLSVVFIFLFFFCCENLPSLTLIFLTPLSMLKDTLPLCVLTLTESQLQTMLHLKEFYTDVTK